MIQIFPRPYNNFVCPSCQQGYPVIERIIFQGIHLLADLRCTKCGFLFYHDFPVGHGVTYPAVVDKQNLKLISPTDKTWYTQPLLESLQNPSNEKVKLEKISNATILPSDTVIFFNCLDSWYGHVLLKLLNIQFYHEQYPDFKKIVLLPKGFQWMVPSYADEIWIADIGLSQCRHYYPALENSVMNQLEKFKVIYHSSGYSHPPLQDIRVEDFFRAEPFDINNFPSSPVKVTFIYREDRLWISAIMNRIFNHLQYRKIKFGKRFFLGLQNARIIKLARYLKKSNHKVEFRVCGLGATGSFGNDIIDKRASKISAETEFEWCRMYAESHIVIGIHGSNMLIPSGLAGGWLEILPDIRLSNITQDLFCRYKFNEMAFFGRFASEYDPVKRIAGTIISMIMAYPGFSSHQAHSYQIK